MTEAPDRRAPGFATEQIHGGVLPDTGHGARITPIHLSAGFLFDDFDHARDRFAGEAEGFTYTRLGNPTTASVERRIAVLEHAQEAIFVGSGQAAVTVALLGILQAGDHVVSSSSIYEGTRGLLTQNLARLGIATSFVADPTDLDAWAAAIRPETRLLFGESIPNPKNDVLDIAGVAGVAHRNGLPLVIDNTLATPYLVRPVEHGADVVVHSASKFLGGHGAAIGGVVVDGGTFDWGAEPGRFPHLTDPDRALGGRSYVERFGPRAYVAFAREVIASRLGPTPSPFTAFLVQQGIETLSLRMDRHSANAARIAAWLEQQPQVERVDYAGLPSNPYHDLAERYLPRGAGSVFAFTLAPVPGAGSDAAGGGAAGGGAAGGGAAGGVAAGGVAAGALEAARRFVDAVGLFSRMTHLGDVRSLVLHPASTTHAQRTPAELEAAGIGPGLIRLSVGLEDVEDLIADVAQALAAVGRPTAPDAAASAWEGRSTPAPHDPSHGSVAEAPAAPIAEEV